MTALRRLARVFIAAHGHSSSFCHLQNGELLVNYSAVGPDGWQVNLVRSDDGGRTWSEPRTVVPARPGKEADCQLGMGQLADGSVIMPYASIQGHPIMGRSAHILISTDNGRTWDGDTKLAPAGAAPSELSWAGVYGRVRQLSDGTVIVGGYGKAPQDRTWRNVHFRSHDGGRTWTETVTVAIGMDDEFDAIELPDGRMMAVFRDWRSPRYGHGMSPLWENWSSDLGRTWSTPEMTFQALYGHSPALFLTKRGTLICGYRYVGDLDQRICGVGFCVWDALHREWSRSEHVVDCVSIRDEYGLGSGYPSWDYADEERLLCVYHANPTYAVGTGRPGHEHGYYSDIEGTFYIEQD